ncbi:MAG: chemotaxis protein CheC [Myxococcales bacterium]|nr:chemotaxis protein CheC [Myxococcales bacterium]
MSEAPSELQLDALREVANVGCGHAADALSRLVGGRRVCMEVPRVAVTASSELELLLGGPDVRVVASMFQLERPLSGCLVLALREEDARLLCSLLLGVHAGGGPLDELRRSALTEAANIVASACLNAMGRLTSLTLLPSTPVMAQGGAQSVLEELLGSSCSAAGQLVLEARFYTAASPLVGGQLLLLPDRAGLNALLSSLGV